MVGPIKYFCEEQIENVYLEGYRWSSAQRTVVSSDEFKSLKGELFPGKWRCFGTPAKNQQLLLCKTIWIISPFLSMAS
jgi:hypothetical protein